jgi:hypothetical protein
MNAESRAGVTFKWFEVLLGICVYYLLFTTIWGFIQSAIEKRLGAGLTRSEDTGLWSRLVGVRGGRTWRQGGIR